MSTLSKILGSNVTELPHSPLVTEFIGQQAPGANAPIARETIGFHQGIRQRLSDTAAFGPQLGSYSHPAGSSSQKLIESLKSAPLRLRNGQETTVLKYLENRTVSNIEQRTNPPPTYQYLKSSEADHLFSITDISSTTMEGKHPNAWYAVAVPDGAEGTHTTVLNEFGAQALRDHLFSSSAVQAMLQKYDNARSKTR